MSDSRKEFEKIPYIKLRLNNVCFIEEENSYLPTQWDYAASVYDMHFVNGAWYAFQQQQQKQIDAIVKIVRDAYMSDGNSSVEIIYDKIQELLK